MSIEDIIRTIVREEIERALASVTAMPAAATPKEVVKEPVEEITYEGHIKPITLELVKEIGKDNTKEILESFGVKGAQALKPEQWPAYMAAAKKALHG